MSKYFLGLIFLSLCCTTIFAQQSLPYQIKKSPGTYYVYAPSGLNMRVAATVDAERILTIPYGEQVELLEPVGKQNLTVDQLQGGMAKISYKGQTGYTFSGYLTRFPAPKSGQDIFKYVEYLRENSQAVLYEACKRDYDGYYQTEEAIILNVQDWAEAFLVAQAIFQLPESLLFPLPSTELTETFENPKKKKSDWEDNLTIRRDADGTVISMNWYARTEGSGKTAYIEVDKMQIGLRIGLVLIAD